MGGRRRLAIFVTIRSSDCRGTKYDRRCFCWKKAIPKEKGLYIDFMASRRLGMMRRADWSLRVLFLCKHTGNVGKNKE